MRVTELVKAAQHLVVNAPQLRRLAQLALTPTFFYHKLALVVVERINTETQLIEHVKPAIQTAKTAVRAPALRAQAA